MNITKINSNEPGTIIVKNRFVYEFHTESKICISFNMKTYGACNYFYLYFSNPFILDNDFLVVSPTEVHVTQEKGIISVVKKMDNNLGTFVNNLLDNLNKTNLFRNDLVSWLLEEKSDKDQEIKNIEEELNDLRLESKKLADMVNELRPVTLTA